MTRRRDETIDAYHARLAAIAVARTTLTDGDADTSAAGIYARLWSSGRADGLHQSAGFAEHVTDRQSEKAEIVFTNAFGGELLQRCGDFGLRRGATREGIGHQKTLSHDDDVESLFRRRLFDWLGHISSILRSCAIKRESAGADKRRAE